MSKQGNMETEIFERVASLETKVNGGPGQSAICKLHQEAVNEVKIRLERIEAKFDSLQNRLTFYAGGICALVAVLNFVAPAIVKHIP